MSIDKFLAAIRYHESRNDYKAQSSRSSASGAYQFIDETWKREGGSTVHAKDATADEQDRIARNYATRLLRKYNDDYHKAARAWKEGERGAERDPNAGKTYADAVIQRMNS
jgi:muramidase (phage lysozyme)